MKIDVKEVRSMWDDDHVTVVMDGICNHAVTDEETAAEYPNGKDEPIMVCLRCGAWKYVNNFWSPDKWYDEVMLEMESV